MIYVIRTIAVYEIEADDDQEARDYYNQGLWDVSDLVDESAGELVRRNEDGTTTILEHI